MEPNVSPIDAGRSSAQPIHSRIGSLPAISKLKGDSNLLPQIQAADESVPER